jgi:uncharacterized protein
LLVRVDTLPPEGAAYSLRFGTDEVDQAFVEVGLKGVRATDDLTAETTVLSSRGDVFVLGALRARVEYRCVRCLTPFEEGVEAKLHLTFAEEAEPIGHLELHREDLDLELLRSGTVDLTRAVLEQLLLALRAHPVCRATCRGLCPQCGSDRNLTDCGCEGKRSDPRFAVLEKWRPGAKNP